MPDRRVRRPDRRCSPFSQAEDVTRPECEAHYDVPGETFVVPLRERRGRFELFDHTARIWQRKHLQISKPAT